MKRDHLLTLFALVLVGALLLGACGPAAPDTIKIGINAPITGDIPKVGEGSKFAAQMWLADIEAAGGLEVSAFRVRCMRSWRPFC